MRHVGGMEGMVSEVTLEFGGWIHCGDSGRGCASLEPGRERLRMFRIKSTLLLS
jgi:hypothetical protein